jgi:DNA-binding NarL/FixJ family response regulator
MAEKKYKGLSAREKDVARFLAQGVSNKEIARGLGIEVVTVKRHIGKILRKLGVTNRTQAAIALAHRHNPEALADLRISVEMQSHEEVQS